MDDTHWIHTDFQHKFKNPGVNSKNEQKQGITWYFEIACPQQRWIGLWLRNWTEKPREILVAIES